MHITNYHAHIVFSLPGYKEKSHTEYNIDGNFIAPSCNLPENRRKEKNNQIYNQIWQKNKCGWKSVRFTLFQFGKSKMFFPLIVKCIDKKIDNGKHFAQFSKMESEEVIEPGSFSYGYSLGVEYFRLISIFKYSL